MKRFSSSQFASYKAFTLIEMLVVVSIVVLLLAFSTPALTRTLQASRLSAAGETIMGALAEAQQLALTNNVPVDMRFFSYQNPMDSAVAVHSYQLLKITQVKDGGGAAASIVESAVPAGNLVNLPEGIVISNDSTISAALSASGMPDTKANSATGYSGVAGATYNAIRFMPDGTCRSVGSSAAGLASLSFPSPNNFFFTVAFDNGGGGVTASNLSKNFYTIQIDPYTGKARSYKPGF